MAVTTNVPPITFNTATGFTGPTQQDILTGVQQDFNAAFGGGLNPSLSTPQGQLAPEPDRGHRAGESIPSSS